MIVWGEEREELSIKNEAYDLTQDAHILVDTTQISDAKNVPPRRKLYQ